MDPYITFEVPPDIRRTVVDAEHVHMIRSWLAAGRGLSVWMDRELSSDRAGNRLTTGDSPAWHWRFGLIAFHIDDIVVCDRGAELCAMRGLSKVKRRAYEDRAGTDVALVYDAERDTVVAYQAVFTPLSKYLAKGE